MKLDALDHPKTLDLAARLNIELPTAIGHLELLWAFTAKKAPQGDLGKWPDGAIARACYWMGRPEAFILALRESGFIDADETHRLTVHDWLEHAPTWVRGKLARMKVGFVSGATTSDHLKVPTSEAPSKRSEAKRSEAKPSEEEARARATPPGLDLEAWTRWEAYRREIRKPLKPVSIPAAQRALAAFGENQAAVVEQSIANQWQGLFELKRAVGVRVRAKTVAELEAEEAARAVG